MSLEIPTKIGAPAPLPHQIENVEYMSQRRVSLLADPPGLGKTYSTILLTNICKPNTVLIICPATLKMNWLREWDKYSTNTHLSISVVTPKYYPGNSNVIIINYELLQKYRSYIEKTSWDIVLIDEAHQCSNPKTQRWLAVFGRKKYKNLSYIAPLKIGKLVWMTGTPILKSPIDIWPFCQIGDPYGLGKDYITFIRRYCNGKKNHFGWDTSGASNLEELKKRLFASFVIMHDKSILNLPKKTRNVIELPKDGLGIERLLEKEKRLYQKLNENGVTDDEIYRYIEDTSLIEEQDTIHEQVSNISGIEHNESITDLNDLAMTRQEVALKKLPMVISFVENIVEQGEKVVIFCHHKSIARALKEHFSECAYITGEVPTNKRQIEVDKFQCEEGCTEFVGQITAAGTGNTLTSSRTVVFAEMDYVPANMLQCEDRVHRISQDRSVNIYYLVLEGSLDATIISRISERLKVIEQVFG